MVPCSKPGSTAEGAFAETARVTRLPPAWICGTPSVLGGSRVVTAIRVLGPAARRYTRGLGLCGGRGDES